MSKTLQAIQMLVAKRDMPSALFRTIRHTRFSDWPSAICHKRFSPNHVLRAMCYVQVFLFAAGCSIGPSLPEIKLAYVNGEPVTVELMESAFSESHRGHSAFLAGQGVVRQVLEKVIDKQLLLQEARRIGLDRDPEVEEAVERLRGARASQQFSRDKITSQVVISEEVILETHKRMGTRFQARHILVENRAVAEEAYDRIQAGADFGEVALKVSQADTAVKGGYMGIIPWGRLEPELEDKLWSLQQREVSQPFETREGWNLLYVTDKRSMEPPPLEKVARQIRAVLTKRETNRLSERVLRDLKERWNPQIDEVAIRDSIKASEPGKLPRDAVLAEVGDEKITLGQTLPRVDWDKVRKLAEPVAFRALRTLVEENYVFPVLMRKEALAQGYGKRAEIQKELDALRNRLAVDYLLARVVFAKLDVTDDEARTYWQAHKEKFTEPETVHLSLIVTESENQAEEILSDLKSGADFAATARQKSKDPLSAQSGGNMGWVTKGRLQPELENVAFSLKKGEFGIAEVQDKYAVVWVENKQPERLKPYTEVQEQAKHLALQDKSRDTLKLWITKLREASVIKIDEEAIRRAAAEYEEKIRQKAEQKHG